MKILEVSLYHPEIVRGGAQQAAYELFCGLRDDGSHDVTFLASIEPEVDRALFKPGAVITGMDGRPGEFLFLSDSFGHEWLRNQNLRALKWFETFVLEQNPDVIHFHHFLTFGLELFLVARRALPNARLFITLHEFLAICKANGHMVRLSDGTLCTHSSPIRCHQCFADVPPETFKMREDWIKQAFAVFDGFICPTQFVKDRYVGWGLDPRRLHVVSNAQRDYSSLGLPALVDASAPAVPARIREVDLAPPHPETKLPPARVRNRFGFFGQLVDVKGLGVVFEAVRLLAKRYDGDVALEINGTNIRYASAPFREKFDAFLETAETEMPNLRVRFNGGYAMSDLPRRMDRVDWVLVPSTWWEIFGLVLSEAYMFGRPPIASRIGGLGERVRHDVDGLLVPAADPDALADTMLRCLTEDGLWARLRAASPGVPPVPGIVAQHLALFAPREAAAEAPVIGLGRMWADARVTG